MNEKHLSAFAVNAADRAIRERNKDYKLAKPVPTYTELAKALRESLPHIDADQAAKVSDILDRIPEVA